MPICKNIEGDPGLLQPQGHPRLDAFGLTDSSFDRIVTKEHRVPHYPGLLAMRRMTFHSCWPWLFISNTDPIFTGQYPDTSREMG